MSIHRLPFGHVAVLVPAVLCTGAVLAFLLGVDFGPLQPFMGRWSFLILEFGGAACSGSADESGG